MSFAQEVAGFINAWNLVDNMQQDRARLDLDREKFSLTKQLADQQQANWDATHELNLRQEERLGAESKSTIAKREFDMNQERMKTGIPMTSGAAFGREMGLNMDGYPYAPAGIPTPGAGLSGNVGGDDLSSAPQWSARDRDIAIRTMLGEAGGEGPTGMAAVAHVLRNRAANGIGGNSLAEVALAPKQFSAWNSPTGGGNNLVNIKPDDPRYQQAAQVFDAVMAGSIDDPTGGATDYHNTTVNPKWAGAYTKTGQLGDHVFYSRPGNKAAAVAANGGAQPASPPVGAIPSDATEQIDFAPLMGGQPITAYGVQIIPQIIDRTGMKGLKPITMQYIEGMARQGKAAGVDKIVITAGQGGGHKSHMSGTEMDVVGYSNGKKWSIGQRNAVARGAAEGGADRFGLYEGRSLHIGSSTGGKASAVWGNHNLTGGDASRAFHHPDNVSFLKDFNAGKLRGGGGSNVMRGGTVSPPDPRMRPNEGGIPDGKPHSNPTIAGYKQAFDDPLAFAAEEDANDPMGIRSDAQKEAMGPVDVADETPSAINAVTLADDAMKGGGTGKPAGDTNTTYPMYYTPDEMGAIMYGVDQTFPGLTPEQRTMKALALTWQYYKRYGDEAASARMASSILSYSEMVSAQIAQKVEQAAQSGDVEAVAALMKQYHQTMPDGKDMSIEPNDDGTYSIQFTDAETGKPATPVQVVTGDDLLAEAFGMKDGPQFDAFLRNGLGGRDKRPEEAYDSAMADLEAKIGEVSGGDWVTPNLGGNRQMPGPTTGPAAIPEAARRQTASTGWTELQNRPPVIPLDIEKMRMMSPADAAAYQAAVGQAQIKYGRVPGTGKELSQAQLKSKVQLSGNDISEITSDYYANKAAQNGVDYAGENDQLSQAQERVVSNAALQIAGMNGNISVPDAVAIADEMLTFDERNPEAVFFRAKANNDGTYSVVTASGKTANMPYPTYWALAAMRDGYEKALYEQERTASGKVADQVATDRRDAVRKTKTDKLDAIARDRARMIRDNGPDGGIGTYSLPPISPNDPARSMMLGIPDDPTGPQPGNGIPIEETGRQRLMRTIEQANRDRRRRGLSLIEQVR